MMPNCSKQCIRMVSVNPNATLHAGDVAEAEDAKALKHDTSVTLHDA